MTTGEKPLFFRLLIPLDEEKYQLFPFDIDVLYSSKCVHCTIHLESRCVHKTVRVPYCTHMVCACFLFLFPSLPYVPFFSFGFIVFIHHPSLLYYNSFVKQDG